MRIVAFSLALAAALPAQNLIANGDFERGDLTGWTVTSGTPAVRVLPTNGGTASLALVHMAAPPCHPVQTVALSQRLAVLPPGRYEVRFDYLVAAAGTRGFGNVEWTLGGNRHPTAVATPHTGVVRGQVGQVHQLPGPLDVGFELTVGECGGWVAVDNVSVRPVRDVHLGTFRFRILGFPTWIPASGTPGAICYLLVGFAPAAAPIAIPGFSGDLRLDPLRAGVFAIGTLDASGSRRFYVTPPATPALAGVDLYWQAAQLDGSTGAGGFSWETLQPFWI